jgi:S1-C subfamily serine protease
MSLRRAIARLIVAAGMATLTGNATAADGAAPSCLEAICKVSTGRHSGSGVVYREDADRYYLLTARHILETSEKSSIVSIKLRFFHDGASSPNMPATVEFTSPPADDLAVISVKKVHFASYPPPAVLPLHSYDVKESERIITIGVPRANDDFTTWPVSMLGRVLEVPSRKTVSFLPLIQPGHSGGALVTDDGRQLIGICIERSTKLVESRALSVFRILELLPDNLK